MLNLRGVLIFFKKKRSLLTSFFHVSSLKDFFKDKKRRVFIREVEFLDDVDYVYLLLLFRLSLQHSKIPLKMGKVTVFLGIIMYKEPILMAIS
jgi:hypothetical protein